MNPIGEPQPNRSVFSTIVTNSSSILSLNRRWRILMTTSTIAAIGTYLYSKRIINRKLLTLSNIYVFFTSKELQHYVWQHIIYARLRTIGKQFIQPFFRERFKRGILFSLIIIWLTLKYQQYLRRAFVSIIIYLFNINGSFYFSV